MFPIPSSMHQNVRLLPATTDIPESFLTSKQRAQIINFDICTVKFWWIRRRIGENLIYSFSNVYSFFNVAFFSLHRHHRHESPFKSAKWLFLFTWCLPENLHSSSRRIFILESNNQPDANFWNAHTHILSILTISGTTLQDQVNKKREREKNQQRNSTQPEISKFIWFAIFFFILSLDGYFLIFICLCSKWILQCNKMRIMFIWYCIQRHTHTHTHSWHNCRWCERTLLLLHICLFDLLVSSFRGSYSW